VTLGPTLEPSPHGRLSRHQATMRGIPLFRGLRRPTKTGTIAQLHTLVYRLTPDVSVEAQPVETAARRGLTFPVRAAPATGVVSLLREG
jgi:hypothetical protein